MALAPISGSHGFRVLQSLNHLFLLDGLQILSLIKASTIVWNRKIEATRDLADLGADVAESAADAARVGHGTGTAFLSDALDGDRAEVSCALTQLLRLLIDL